MPEKVYDGKTINEILLNKIVTLTEEVVVLQKENDKLQKKTFYVAVIAIIVSIALPLLLRI